MILSRCKVQTDHPSAFGQSSSLDHAFPSLLKLSILATLCATIDIKVWSSNHEY